MAGNSELPPELDPDAPSVYQRSSDGATVYRISALGGCKRMLVACRVGELDAAPPPEFMLRRFQQGHDGEQEIIDKFVGLGEWEVEVQQAVAELEVLPGIFIVGHIDAGIKHVTDDRRAIAEIKLFGPDNMALFQKKGLAGFPRYEWQISGYMHALGVPVMFIVCERDGDGKVIGFPDWRWIEQPPVSLAKMKQKIRSIEKYAASGSEAECSKDFPCPFYQVLCEEEQRTLMIGTNEELDRWFAAYENARVESQKWEGVKKEAREAIAKIYDAHDLRGGEWQTDTYCIVDQVNEGRRFISEAKMKAAGLDPEEFKDTGNESRFPRGKLLKEKDNG